MPFRPNPARCPGGKLGRKCRVRPDGGEPAIEADVYILCVCRCWGKVCHANVQLAGKVVRRKVFFVFLPLSFPSSPPAGHKKLRVFAFPPLVLCIWTERILFSFTSSPPFWIGFRVILQRGERMFEDLDRVSTVFHSCLSPSCSARPRKVTGNNWVVKSNRTIYDVSVVVVIDKRTS